MAHDMTLYQLPGCPFCKKVRDRLEELGLDYELVNVERDREDPLRKKLSDATGSHTVPVLELDGEYYGESERILKLLDSISQEA